MRRVKDAVSRTTNFRKAGSRRTMTIAARPRPGQGLQSCIGGERHEEKEHVRDGDGKADRP